MLNLHFVYSLSMKNMGSAVGAKAFILAAKLPDRQGSSGGLPHAFSPPRQLCVGPGAVLPQLVAWLGSKLAQGNGTRLCLICEGIGVFVFVLIHHFWQLLNPVRLHCEGRERAGQHKEASGGLGWGGLAPSPTAVCHMCGGFSYLK